MKLLTSETFFSTEDLTDFVNIRGIEKKDIVAINTILDQNEDTIFYIFFFSEE